MKFKDINPRLSLVGAGPGDPELITLKAIKTLQSAQVVLYDALLDDDLLKYAPLAKKIFVGKRKGQHYRTQEEINQLIVKEAYEHGHVVRLKGGDPFVFGRANEEIEYAQQHGIEVSLVPGISSATAVPALAGYPLTKRREAESFWVITGTTAARTLSQDVYWAAKSSATVVILMGMSQLAAIQDVFKDAGKAALPVAIIQNGSTDKEKIVSGNVDNIADRAANAGLGAPAIIVLGEVAANPVQLSRLEFSKDFEKFPAYL